MQWFFFPSELGLISLHWFLTIFASVVHMKVLMRIWDLFFYDGSIVLFQIMIGMLKMKVCLEFYTIMNAETSSLVLITVLILY